MTIRITQKNQTSLVPKGHLMQSQKMELALQVLHLPIHELEALFQEEMRLNPLVEEEEARREVLETVDLSELELDFSNHNPNYLETLDDSYYEEERSFQAKEIPAILSPYEHLMEQAKRHFSTEEELKIASIIIGSLESNGLLRRSINEIAHQCKSALPQVEKVLKKIQEFDPEGVASKSRQELLIRRLKRRGNPLAEQIVTEYYQELLANQLSKICKKLSITKEELQETIDEILAPLSADPLHPIESHPISEEIDLQIFQEGDQLKIAIFAPLIDAIIIKDREDFPFMNAELMRYIQKKRKSAYWLLQAIERRTSLLTKIGEAIIENCGPYLLSLTSSMPSIKMKELALKLNLHISTLSRAIALKRIETPRGIYPLKAFFSYPYCKADGEMISADSIKERLRQIIASEKKPLTDEAIVLIFKKEKIELNRRTVAKYRKELNILNSRQRS